MVWLDEKNREALIYLLKLCSEVIDAEVLHKKIPFTEDNLLQISNGLHGTISEFSRQK